MKHSARTALYALLAAEAAGCAAFCLTQASAASWPIAAAAFPLAQAGSALRALSLSGAGGNLAAWFFYILLSLLPLGVFFWLAAAKRRRAPDWLLPALTALLFYALYGMINPGVLPFSSQLPQDAGKVVVNATFCSVLLAWALLRWMDALETRSTARLGTLLHMFLAVLAALFLASVFGIALSDTLRALQSLRAANTGRAAGELALTEGFLWARWAVDSLPALLDLAVLHGLSRLLDSAQDGLYSEQTVEATAALARWCRRSVAAAVLLQAGLDLAQLACAGSLYKIDAVLHFPAAAIGFALGALLLARWIAAGKELKDENERFI